MLGYTKKKILRVIKLDFVRFCIVGGTGFVINLTILQLLYRALNFPILPAQLIGAELALFSNFILHHHWTYKKNRVVKNIKTLILQFHVTTWPAILGSSIMVAAGVSIVHLNSTVALVLSSLIALLWNFFWSKYVVWKDTTDEELRRVVQ
jgi:dolichol-phosphate mannosyltransferase